MDNPGEPVVQALQYTKDHLPHRDRSLLPLIRGRLRWAGPAAAAAVLAAAGALAHHVSPLEEADWLSRLAQNGDTGAQLELGLAYRAGRDGLALDPGTGLYWLKRAAQGGNAYAADLVGNAYANGEGTAVNTELAHHWWQTAADAGNVDAKRQLGEVLPDTLQTVKRVLTGEAVHDQSGAELLKRAQAGDPVAEYQLSVRYGDGAWGVERDPTLARHWLERAAADGNPVARKALAEGRQ
jgi:TPR repeat protein